MTHPGELLDDEVLNRCEVKLEFVDSKGNCLAPRFMASIEPARPAAIHYLFSFDVLPPEGTRLRVFLATPESLQPVKFKVENIAL
jgi:hypothetical protein